MGIQVCVEAGEKSTGILPAGGCVVDHERFQQLNQNFLSILDSLASCSGTNTGAYDFELILSTLSAHSINFISLAPKGSRHVVAK